MKIMKEFKEFIMRGNVLDMAVGVIIGAAFGKIVTSLVNDLLMPVIGILAGKVNVSELTWTLSGLGAEPVVVAYGAFLQALLDFLLVALCIFMLIKLLAFLKTRMAKETPNGEAEESDNAGEPEADEDAGEDAEQPEPTEDVLLLREIRDLLREAKG